MGIGSVYLRLWFVPPASHRAVWPSAGAAHIMASSSRNSWFTPPPHRVCELTVNLTEYCSLYFSIFIPFLFYQSSACTLLKKSHSIARLKSKTPLYALAPIPLTASLNFFHEFCLLSCLLYCYLLTFQFSFQHYLWALL